MTPRELLALTIATYVLSKMIGTGGLKEDKVRAAFEYADLLIEEVNNYADDNNSVDTVKGK
jgi:hypothetical protein